MNPRLTYRESAVPGASPVRLVILLYEQAIEDLRCALAACRAGDVAEQIEDRTRHINHAVLILGCLQSSLDAERGGTVAAHLDRFYNQVRAGLVEAQCGQSVAVLERQISHLTEVHQAWCEVERAEAASTASVDSLAGKSKLNQPAMSQRTINHNEAESVTRSSAEWNA
jgi:flagellar secretion chaperone FliS